MAPPERDRARPVRGAEGATSPEPLRQQGLDGISGSGVCAATEGEAAGGTSVGRETT